MPAFQTRSERIAHWAVGILCPPRCGVVMWKRGKEREKLSGTIAMGFPACTASMSEMVPGTGEFLGIPSQTASNSVLFP